MNEELTPCPFCGGKRITINQTYCTDMNVRCSDCSANIDVKDWGKFPNIIKAWNRRAE